MWRAESATRNNGKVTRTGKCRPLTRHKKCLGRIKKGVLEPGWRHRLKHLSQPTDKWLSKEFRWAMSSFHPRLSPFCLRIGLVTGTRIMRFKMGEKWSRKYRDNLHQESRAFVHWALTLKTRALGANTESVSVGERDVSSSGIEPSTTTSGNNPYNCITVGQEG